MIAGDGLTLKKQSAYALGMKLKCAYITGQKVYQVDYRFELADTIAKTAKVDRYRYTAVSVAGFDAAYANANNVYGDEGATDVEMIGAASALKLAIKTLMPATFSTSIKSMLLKVARNQKIDVVYNGIGTLIFASSNSSVCSVSADGLVMGLKVGTVVITISVQSLPSLIFTVSVSN